MIAIEAADAAIGLDRRTGSLTSLRVGKPRVRIASGEPVGFLEVTDLRDGRSYHPLKAEFEISDWERSSAGPRKGVSFSQQYRDAPFRIEQSLRETRAGIRWEASLRLLGGQKHGRSVRVTWVLPIPGGWKFWVPQDTTVHHNDGVTPRRYVYGHISFRPYGTMIPLVATWDAGLRRRRQPAPPRRRAALVAFSPPDVQKTYISFDLHTQAAWLGVCLRASAFDVPHR